MHQEFTYILYTLHFKVYNLFYHLFERVVKLDFKNEYLTEEKQSAT